MIVATMAIRRAPDSWLLYALAWAPLFAVNSFAVQLRGGLSAIAVVALAAANVVPDAGLGALVLLQRAMVWRRRPGARQIGLLLGVAAVFAAVSVVVKVGANFAVAWAEGAPLDWSRYDSSILVWQVFLSLLAFAAVAGAAFGLVAVEDLRRETARRAEAELLHSRSELKALRAQLNPHFLFNTLHSVRALIVDRPRDAEAALIHLGDMLRYALRVQNAAEEGVLLADEWEFARVYLEIEQLRLGDRLHVEAVASDAALAAVVPAFVLQPLVENAIVHGIAPSRQGGGITIRAELTNDVLCLQVENGVGSRVATPSSAREDGGRGLALVTTRLRALHGDKASVSVSAGEDRHRVVLRFPAKVESL